jgi:hypothetical protein
MEDESKTLYRQEMARMWRAVAIHALKREKKPLEETSSELFDRLSEEKEARKVRRVKSAAKAAVKQKKIKPMTAYFGRK